MLQKLRGHERLLCALCVLLIVALIFAALCHCTGVKCTRYAYRSYALQAQAWLRGDAALDKNYESLELAVYKDHYYVSFPPVPSVPMLLWTQIWGDDVPEGLFQKIYVALACLTILFALMRGLRKEAALAGGEALERREIDATGRDCAAWAIFLGLGSAMLPIALVGAVWYEAQIFAFLFCVCAISAMDRNHPTISCLCYALSVGCRPFSVCLGPVLLMIYLKRTRDMSIKRRVLRLIPGLLVGLSIAAAYGAYNYVRFDNPFEFGHTYLPEFQRAEHGQFSLYYAAKNWKQALFGSPFVDGEKEKVFQRFGFSLFLSCPILICQVVWVALDIVRRRFTKEKLVIVLIEALTLFLLLLHRTLGGFQFGFRYALELVPPCFAYLLASPERWRISRWEAGLMCFGLAFNFVGGVMLHV